MGCEDVLKSVDFATKTLEALQKQCRNLFISLVVCIITMSILCGGIVGGFIWYINQFEVVDESVTVDAENSPANYIGKDGNVFNSESGDMNGNCKSEKNR